MSVKNGESKLNITYLIGNGFDLSLGMHTSPRDFLNHFVEEHTNDVNDPAQHLAQTIQEEGIDAWSDFEMAIGRHSSHFHDSPSDVERYLDEVDLLETDLSAWLKEQDEALSNSDLENRAKTIFPAFMNIQQLLAQNGVPLINSQGSADRYHFLCFNYTSAFKRCLASYRKGSPYETIFDTLGELITPHGTLETLLVCGVDGPDQIANPSYQSNDEVVSSVVKRGIQQETSFLFDSKGMRLIEQSDIVCIFGMSLGSSDRRWWRQIIDALASASLPLRRLVIFSYEMNGARIDTPPSRTRATNRVRNRFFEAAETPDTLREVLKSAVLAYPDQFLFQDFTQ